MKLDPRLEEELKSIAIKYLEKGKEDWDVPHTLTAVHYMRKLIEEEGGDERILLTTMYLHDIGYPSTKNYNLEGLKKAKRLHAEKGAEKAKEILRRLEYSDDEIRKITTLIKNHDKYATMELNTHDKIMVVEADGIAQIDWERCPPNMGKEDSLRRLDYYKKKRVPCFKTKTGKKYLKKLLVKAEQYFD